MRDISKKLTVINTGTKESEAGAASQPSGVVYVGAGGGGGGGNMNDYLLKSIWNKVWEIRTDSQGTEYIYGKLPVVLQYGLTMYSGEGVDIPSIYEGLPIDNDTIYWKDGILKAKAGTEGAITEITSSMVTSALGYTPYDASNPNGYITSAALSNYALSSDVEAVSTKLNDFLEGSDTDNIINKWKELETFLSGLSQSDNLATILGNKAEKTDLAKYIPIAGATEITGEKNFVGGLKVNGSPITYDMEKKYWKLEGDLLVTGGVTMFGNEGTYTPSTIMDAILYDDSTLGINSNGELYVKGGTGGGTVSGDYLPLSGGQMLGDISFQNTNTGVNFQGSHLLVVSSTWSGSQGGNPTSIFGSNSFPTTIRSSSDNLCHYNASKGSLYNILTSGNYSSYVLPLSGGTLTGNLTVAQILNTSGNVLISQSSGNSTYVGNASVKTILFAASGLKADISGSRYDIWHNGNDGSGSGLDADLLDGKHYSDIINGNVASATKLQTARTIWGQSFDGTGNIEGTFKLGAYELQKDEHGIKFYGTYPTLFIQSSNQYNSGITFKGVDGSDKWSFSYRGQNNANDDLYIYNITGDIYDAVMSFIRSTGNIGIGTISPTYRLDVTSTSGDILRLTSTATYSCMRYAHSGAYAWATGADADNKFFFWNSQTSNYRATIDGSGNILAYGGVTMYSDKRKKTILNHVVLSLQQVANAPLIEHYYNSDQAKTTHVGSIAQYWAEMNDWFCKKDSEGFYTMEIQNAALASAISVARELVKFETETDRRIRLLEEENKRLKEEVEYLKLNVA